MAKAFITDFGLDEFSRAAQRGADLSPSDQQREAGLVLDQILAEWQRYTGFRPDDTFDFNGRPTSFGDAFKLVAAHLDSLRLDSIRLFEGYFERNTNIEKLISAFESGEREARQVIRYASIFPIEAVNVRAELAFPAYMRLRAQENEQDKGQLAALYPRAEGYFVHLRGPNIPPLPDPQILSALKENIPKFDQAVRQAISEHQGLPPPKAN